MDIESPDLTRKDRLIYAKEQMFSTFKKVFPYILLGVGIGALIHNWVPEEWVASVLGRNNPFGVILATLIGARCTVIFWYDSYCRSIALQRSSVGYGTILHDGDHHLVPSVINHASQSR